GSNALEKLEFLQNPARAFGNGAQGIVSNVNRQAGFFSDEAVDVAQQRATTSHDDAAVHQVGGQFRRAAFEGNANGFQNLRERLLQGLANFFRANGQGLRQSCAQIAAFYFHG